MVDELPVVAHVVLQVLPEKVLDLLRREVELDELPPDALLVHDVLHDVARPRRVLEILVVGQTEEHLADALFGKVLQLWELLLAGLKRCYGQLHHR